MPRVSAPERREALLVAAFRVIAERGLAAATTRAIVAEAGASLASFHYAFESRDALLAALVGRVTDGEQDSALSALRPGADLAEVLTEGFLAYLELVRRDPHREQAMFELTQYALRTPGLEALAATQYRAYLDTAEHLLVVAAGHAGARWTSPVAELARLLVALSDGVTISWLADRDDAAAHRTIGHAVRALLAHARPNEEPR